MNTDDADREREQPPSRALVDQLFRRQYARLVARLTRVFGAARLELAEDVVQEALVRALQTWPYQGQPSDPEAWLVRVAKNLALDALRRHELARRAETELEQWAGLALSRDPALAEIQQDELRDDALRMIFTACHPALPLEGRVVLTLKTSCGFGTDEIARALLAKETAIAQRLVRARQRLQVEEIAFDVPSPSELPARLDAVLEVLYLVFNEGHGATRGADLVRPELVHDALRLGELLLERPELDLPRVHALLALMYLQGARLGARTSAAGELTPLAEQDRSRWNTEWIARGLGHFEQSMAGNELTAFHVEASIACVHARAASYAETDWAEILARYDLLLVLADTPVVRLNRAVALSKVHGLAAGLAEVERAGADGALDEYVLWHATRARMAWALGRSEQALASFDAALALQASEPELEHLRTLRERCARGEASLAF